MRLVPSLCLFVALAAGAAAAESGARWNARGPATCAPLIQAVPPSPAQVARLLQCAHEDITRTDELWLLTNIRAEVGDGVFFGELYNVIHMEDADTTKEVHPLSGSWTLSVCRLPEYVDNPARNCSESDVTGATGACWLTTAGDWRCLMNGSTGPFRANTAPPQ